MCVDLDVESDWLSWCNVFCVCVWDDVWVIVCEIGVGKVMIMMYVLLMCEMCELLFFGVRWGKVVMSVGFLGKSDDWWWLTARWLGFVSEKDKVIDDEFEVCECLGMKEVEVYCVSWLF